MTTAKVKLVDGSVDIFNTEKYILSPVKLMHPDILEVWIFTDGKKIAHVKRHFQKFYKTFLYKPVQQELKPEGEEAPAAEEVKENT